MNKMNDIRIDLTNIKTLNKKGEFSPSHFLVMCCPGQITDRNHSLTDFLSVAKAKPEISVSTRSFIIHITFSPSTQIAVDRENNVTLLLHGEIYGTKDNQAEFLIKQFIKRGIDFSKDINGSFVILLIDKRYDTVSLITDRINTRKVFWSKYDGNYWLSTSLYIHPTAGVDIDPIGVACYLANGVVHNNRTLFDGVRILDRACVHKLTQDGFQTSRYWSYEFTNSYLGTDEKKLCAELSELLVGSVRIRLSDDPEIFLSLSAGYDATGILGILGSKLNIPNVECFSYALGNPGSESDAYISEELANCFGFNHKIIQSYKGGLLGIINHNANLNQGVANFCDEVDAWIEMAEDFSAKSKSALFVGDECFGWKDCELNSGIDVLNSVAIYDFGGLSWLQDMLPKEIYNTLSNGLNEDISQILRRCPPTRDYHDSKDFLYLDQRLSNDILAWRVFFAGQFVMVRNPFLDNSILDFMMKIPSSLRCGKRFYKETIIKMFPDLFRFRRARASDYVANWKNELAFQLPAIKSLISSRYSKLDEIIPPEVILQLLEENKIGEPNRFSPKTVPIKILRRLLRRTHVGGKLMSCFFDTTKKRLDSITLLKRILVMRLFLSKICNP